ncbi:MAG TPA: ferritin-like domain-containing protein [Nitrospiraceae bacterium]|nr:ferritin-like domain-containing protein [Nitrospiraceae bacterium]
MLIKADERVPIARLLQFLEHGERLAHDCAKDQARLAPEAGVRRFLLAQARQEYAHAVIFQGAIAWLAPRHVGACPLLPPLERYRSLLEEALRKGRLGETFMAEQIILEGLGEAILSRIEEGLTKRQAPFARLRRILLHQEEAHHDFGRRMLDRGFAAESESTDTLRRRAQDYLALTDAMVRGVADLFDSIDEDPGLYASRARSYLPDWLMGTRSGLEAMGYRHEANIGPAPCLVPLAFLLVAKKGSDARRQGSEE